MNRPPPSSARRWLLIVLIVVCAVALFDAGSRLWRWWNAPPRMTLQEALWVTEHDYSRYFGPGTPQSREVAEALAPHYSITERRFDSFVLYRRGLSESSAGREVLLVVGFDPSSIPPALRAGK